MRSSTLTLVTCALFLAPIFAAAETSNISDRFYDAIRRDDTAAVQKLLASGADVNAKDSRGGTPLMYAAAAGSEAMMRRLIDARADVNAANAFGATALLLCTNSLSRVKLLIDHGADVRVRSKHGHTPVELAARHAGGLEVVKLLLAKGASLQVPPDDDGIMPVAGAAAVNDAALVQFIVEKGGKEALAGPGGPMALIQAASFGNTEIVKLLLSKGVDVNSASPPETERVKNGPIALGSFTPLILAVAAGNTETVRTLLDAGANVNARDVRDMTPLMLAVATDHPNRDIIGLLLERHPNAKAKSKAGETALDWALKFKDPAIVASIRAASEGVQPAGATAPGTTRNANTDVRMAIEKSTALLQRSGATTFREGGCISCHGGNAVTAAVVAARHAGIRVDDAAFAETLKGLRLQFAARAEGFLERTDPPVPLIPSHALYALAEEGAPADRITDAMVHNIAGQQLADGTWSSRGIMRPPTADAVFPNSAYAIRAFKQYAPPAQRAEYDERIARAARALAAAEPSTTDDYVMQLLGLKWAGAPAGKLDAIARRLTAEQRSDGGWAQTQFLASDAYATGSVLHALYEAGVLPDAPAYKKGVAFLLKSQGADGSWHVASRAPKFQPYFDGGFPYGHDQWISQWATGWAAMALSHALPATRSAAK